MKKEKNFITGRRKAAVFSGIIFDSNFGRLSARSVIITPIIIKYRNVNRIINFKYVCGEYMKKSIKIVVAKETAKTLNILHHKRQESDSLCGFSNALRTALYRFESSFSKRVFLHNRKAESKREKTPLKIMGANVINMQINI